jgi:uncharacterized protein (TIGR00369 family)
MTDERKWNIEGDDTMSFKSLDPNYEMKVRESFLRQGFMKFIGAELVEVKPGYCEIHLPYKKELSQQHGFFHAGVIGTIADNTGGYAAYSLMGAESSILTVEYKLNLVAPGVGDLLIGRARVVKPGRTLTVCRSEVFVVKNGIEKLCATSLMTLMAMTAMANEPAPNKKKKSNKA